LLGCILGGCSRRKDCNGYSLYLTFDDGPGNGTEEILNNLRDKNIKATFFVNGKYISEKSSRASENLILLNRIADEGHLIGNHSYSHKFSNYYLGEDQQEMVKDFQLNEEVLKKTLKSYDFAKIARLPGSDSWRYENISKDSYVRLRSYSFWLRSTKDTADALSREGYSIFGWDIEWGMTGPNDIYLEKSAATIANEIILKFREQCKIILLAHDRSFMHINPETGQEIGNHNKVKELINLLEKSNLTINFDTLDNY